jgi:hypothetical protein
MQPDEGNSLTRQKWVRIMADFSADGVWNKQGQLCELDCLPVSGALKARISAWMDWFDRGADRSDRTAIPFNVRIFTEEGLQIARDVKRELPDWTVVYFDEERSNEWIYHRRVGDRSYFEYEIHSADLNDEPRRC